MLHSSLNRLPYPNFSSLYEKLLEDWTLEVTQYKAIVMTLWTQERLVNFVILHFKLFVSFQPLVNNL